ncbi:hypothetical protein Tco_0355052 [Tanacetum coccineum]
MGAQGFLASVYGHILESPNNENLFVFRDSYVFPDELPGLPLAKEIEFGIELIPGAEPISKAPYRMATRLCARVTKIEKAFIKRCWRLALLDPVFRPWGAPRIMMDPSKVEAITKCPRPTTVNEVKFSGLCWLLPTFFEGEFLGIENGDCVMLSPILTHTISYVYEVSGAIGASMRIESNLMQKIKELKGRRFNQDVQRFETYFWWNGMKQERWLRIVSKCMTFPDRHLFAGDYEYRIGVFDCDRFKLIEITNEKVVDAKES